MYSIKPRRLIKNISYHFSTTNKKNRKKWSKLFRSFSGFKWRRRRVSENWKFYRKLNRKFYSGLSGHTVRFLSAVFVFRRVAGITEKLAENVATMKNANIWCTTYLPANNIWRLYIWKSRNITNKMCPKNFPFLPHDIFSIYFFLSNNLCGSYHF